MGCKQSTLKNEEFTKAQPVKPTSPVRAEISVEPVAVSATASTPERMPEVKCGADEVTAPATVEASVEIQPEMMPVETVVESPAMEQPVETAPIEPLVKAQKPAKKKRAPKAQKTVVPAASINDENAQPSKVAPAEVQQKRVAFAKRSNNTTVAPKATRVSKTRKGKSVAQPNMNEDKFKQMTMAFQRLLTHADHLEAQLATR